MPVRALGPWCDYSTGVRVGGCIDGQGSTTHQSTKPIPNWSVQVSDGDSRPNLNRNSVITVAISTADSGRAYCWGPLVVNSRNFSTLISPPIRYHINFSCTVVKRPTTKVRLGGYVTQLPNRGDCLQTIQLFFSDFFFSEGEIWGTSDRYYLAGQGRRKNTK